LPPLLLDDLVVQVLDAGLVGIERLPLGFLRDRRVGGVGGVVRGIVPRLDALVGVPDGLELANRAAVVRMSPLHPGTVGVLDGLVVRVGVDVEDVERGYHTPP
jgi:hypothetical protein